ncbi:MAG: hypothetical protein KGL39_09640 [Patescibacteria group bacterium]|nr:hypothetical protein [Patescibacteria group bacterium]
MPKANKTMSAWLKRATPQQKKRLAELARTSVPHLGHAARGRRTMSAELAQRIAAASAKLGAPELVIEQPDLCAACAKCPLRIDPLTA